MRLVAVLWPCWVEGALVDLFLDLLGLAVMLL